MSAFFAFVILFFILNTSYAGCGTQQYDDVAVVRHVVDGDTLALTDKRTVRLIGVNAPELAHYPKKEEPLALSAKQYIESVLLLNKKIKLKYGVQQKDRYGRILAHIFLEDGRNLNAMLLERGLASAIVIPPNSLFYECYFRLEQSAKKESRPYKTTLWTHKYFRYQHAGKIDKSMTGFHFIKGKVMRIGRSRDSIWLQLAPKFTIRIKRKDFHNFNMIKLRSLELKQIRNKTIYLRGWVYEWKNEMYIQLRHPKMISDGLLTPLV